jgi:DNA-binding MarR family transcriptional regulator
MDGAAPPTASDRESALARGDRLEVRLWLRLLTCSSLIERRVRRRLAIEFKTTLPRFDLLAQLDRAPEGLMMGALSQRLMVSNGNVTGLVGRLAREGLVAREAPARDRRRARVRLTQAGKRVFDAITPAHARWIDEAMRGLRRGEMAQLHALLGRLKDAAQARPR